MTPTPVPTLDALSIVVDDMAATIAFYSRLGFPFEPDAAQEPHVETSLGTIQLLFDTRAVVESFMPAWTPPTGGHRLALAFRCAAPEDVDALHSVFADAGATSIRDPFDAVWGQRYAIVADPDGNPIDLYSPLA